MNGIRVCSRLRSFVQTGGRTGSVHSVFTHAVNLLFEERMVTVLPASRGLVPYGCGVDVTVPFQDYGLEVGMPAYLGENRLSAAMMHIDLSSAKGVDLRLHNISIDSPPVRICSGADVVLEFLNEAENGEGLSSLVTNGAYNLFARFIAPRISVLVSAMETEPDEKVVAAAAACAGCGMGLTPSSDDLLTGYFATYRLLCEAGNTRDRHEILPVMARAAAAKTNRISGTFLMDSADGLVSEDFLFLLQCIFSDAEKRVLSQAAARVASFGSTSGRDMLTGLILAIQHHNGGKNSG